MATFNEGLQATIAAAQALIGAITGVAAAPEQPTDAPSGQWPYCIAFPASGSFSGGGGGSVQLQGLHTVVFQIHYARHDLKTAYDAILPYVEEVANALTADPTITATATTTNDVRYTFGAMEYAGIDTIGWQFEVQFKIRYTEV